MVKYKITHDRKNCIGCGACAALAEEYWEMDDDGKSNLKKSKPDGKNQFREIEESEFEINKEAAESCPVNVIHLKNLETDEDLI